MYSPHPIFLPQSLQCRALQQAQERLLDCKLSTDGCELPLRADGSASPGNTLKHYSRLADIPRTTRGSPVTNHNLRSLVVRAIKAINADKESLKLQKEFYEKIGHPLDTLH